MRFINKSFCYFTLLHLSITPLNGQLISIRLEDKRPQAEASSAVHQAADALSEEKYTPVNAYTVRHSFTALNELSEDTPLTMLSISTELPLYREPAQVAANGKCNFLHKASGTIFPYRINGFERAKLIFSSESKIEVIYKTAKEQSTFTVALIPADEATEGRLRNTYLAGIKQMAKEKGKNYSPKPTFLKFRGLKYTNAGVEGTYVHDEKEFSQLQVFDCGSWVLTIQLDMKGMEEEQFKLFGNDLIRYLNPARLTALKLMNLKPNVDFDNESLKDTVVTGALVASAFKKMDWATENVSERERYAGFPDIYLTMHTESLREYLRILTRKPNRTKSPENLRFYADLKAIHDAGFLNEFVVETYENVMIVPEHIQLNFPAYRKWKQQREELKVDLLKKRYKINYRPLPY